VGNLSRTDLPHHPNAFTKIYGTYDSDGEITAAFNEAGVDSVDFPDRYTDYLKIGPDPFEILVIVPLGTFLSAIAAKAGEDTWNALKRLVGRILHRSRAKQSGTPFMLADEESRHTFCFWEDTPDDAYKIISRKYEVLKRVEPEPRPNPSMVYFRYEPKSNAWVRWSPPRRTWHQRDVVDDA
jgi:hypothetical protein